MTPSKPKPTHAMVLAAGLGRRMQASENDPPKPLTKIGGVTLLDRMLTYLADFGVTHVVINLHHKSEMIEAHLRDLDYPFEIIFSDERACLMETGGGVYQALPMLGNKPFFVCNADILWIENTSNDKMTALEKLAGTFEPEKMDSCLLLASRDNCPDYDGAGDFNYTQHGKIERRRSQSGDRLEAKWIYAGVQIVSPSLLDKTPETVKSRPFSFNLLWDEALSAARLYGCSLEGTWLHVGTPEGVRDAERILQEK